MEGFWKTAVKVTGSVAVVGFAFTLLIQNIYKEEIIQNFGSERLFYITIALIAVLFIALITAIITNQNSKRKKEAPKPVDKRSVNIERSKVKGDVVMGNKNVSAESKRDD